MEIIEINYRIQQDSI